MDMDLSSDEDVYPPVSEVSGSLGAKVPSTSAPKKKKKPPLIPPVTKAKIKLASSSARQKDPLPPVSVVASAGHTGQAASVTGASKGPPLHQVSNSTGVNGQVERGPSTGVGGGSTASQTVNGQDSVTPVCVSLAPSTHSQLGYGANVDQPSSVWDPSGTPLAVLSSAPNPVGPGAPLPVVSEVGTLGPRMSHVIQGPSNPTGHGSYPQGVMRPAYGYPIPRISGYPTRPGFSDIRFSGYPDNRPPGYSDFRISGYPDYGTRFPGYSDPRFAGFPDPGWAAPPAQSHQAYGPHPTDSFGVWRRGLPGPEGPPHTHPAPPAAGVMAPPPPPPSTAFGSVDGAGAAAPTASDVSVDSRSVRLWLESDTTSVVSVDHGPPTLPLPTPVGMAVSLEGSSSSESSDSDASEDSTPGPAAPTMDHPTSAYYLISKYMPESVVQGAPAPAGGTVFGVAAPTKTKLSIPDEFKDLVRSEYAARSDLKKPHSVKRIGPSLTFDDASTEALFAPKKISKEASRFGAKVNRSVEAPALRSADRRLIEVEGGIRSGMRLSAFLSILLSLRSRSSELKISAEDSRVLDELLLPLSAQVFRQLTAVSLRVTEDRQRNLLSHLALTDALDIRPWVDSLDPAAPLLFGGQFHSLCSSELSELKQAEELAKKITSTKKKSSKRSHATAVSSASATWQQNPPSTSTPPPPKKVKKHKSKRSRRSGGSSAKFPPPPSQAKAKGGRG